jgi:glycerol-3-phosphate dehydrogenase
LKRDLAKLEGTRFDLAVIGGGIAGACIARDAALRGLSVALVEGADFGAAASHNSLRLVHSGLRYAQSLDLLRMRQSAGELRAWLTTAPHLVRTIPVVVPATGHGLRGPLALGAGSALYRFATAAVWTGEAADLRPPAPRVLGPGECRALNPWLGPAAVTGGLLWHDGQILDPDRLIQEIVADAAGAGATVANHLKAGALHASAEGATIACADLLGGHPVHLRARLVVNATGSDAPFLATALGGKPDRLPRFVRALNLVTRTVGPDRAVGLRGPGGRLFFITPGRGHSLVGTAQYADPAGEELAPDGFLEADVERFLAELDQACPALGLGRRDVRHVLAGRIAAAPDGVGLASRPALVDHGRQGGPDGLISVVSNKFTTARLLAERTVDLAVRRLGLRVSRCATASRLLPGARASMQRPGLVNPAALARWAVRSTLAGSLGDVVLRRLRLDQTLALGPAQLEALSRALAGELGQPEERRLAELGAVAERLGLAERTPLPSHAPERSAARA